MEKNNYIFRNRYFTSDELQLIKSIIAEYWPYGRKKIATVICEKLNWRGFNSRLKVIACLEALRKMEKQRLVFLPPINPRGGYRKIKPLNSEEVNFKKPEEEITETIKTMGEVHFELVKTKKEDKLWRYLIQCYHYLGYTRPVGRHLKYFVYLGSKLVALISFSDGIYHHHLRDDWLGWDENTKATQRHLVINNNRFLILPWVKIKNLGSKILGLATRIVPDDWEVRYGYRPYLFGTFVDVDRFKGTVYKAANWRFLGLTCGKGRCGARYFFHGKVRAYYIYPLSKD